MRIADLDPKLAGVALLTPLEVGRLLRLKPQTLAAQRSRRTSPLAFVRLGPRCIRYRAADIERAITDATVGRAER